MDNTALGIQNAQQLLTVVYEKTIDTFGTSEIDMTESLCFYLKNK